MTLKQVLENIKLSENFRAIEFANSLDGFALELRDMKLIESLQTLRYIVGPVAVTSGYRTEKFNKSVGGYINSYHLVGLAADIRFDFTGWTVNSLTKLFQYLEFTNVNFYLRANNTIDRIHVDIGRTWNGQKFNYRNLKA
jgi:uncharacterized protein YcbK (DUF882 family)